MIESEHFALASRTEQLITAGAECRKQLGFTFMIIYSDCVDGAMLALCCSSRSRPIQLGQRELAG